MQGVERDEVRNDVSTQPLNFLRFAVGFASLKTSFDGSDDDLCMKVRRPRNAKIPDALLLVRTDDIGRKRSPDLINLVV
ncbi:hypothetical protein X744_10165 [Mesorhizobium sp. LNJC372A00]|nr:hypothetical protein X753_16030 [Mesorhizobium sp. LNJC399B00]ESY58288.1 hypothetical protein X745_03440 [Mesorhizobium sp. LNJC374B00]ESY60706.1 hypothetical protein X744_10165 [Mesorhizobium sp. LNJC372A00]